MSQSNLNAHFILGLSVFVPIQVWDLSVEVQVLRCEGHQKEVHEF